MLKNVQIIVKGSRLKTGHLHYAGNSFYLWLHCALIWYLTGLQQLTRYEEKTCSLDPESYLKPQLCTWNKQTSLSTCLSSLLMGWWDSSFSHSGISKMTVAIHIYTHTLAAFPRFVKKLLSAKSFLGAVLRELWKKDVFPRVVLSLRRSFTKKET